MPFLSHNDARGRDFLRKHPIERVSFRPEEHNTRLNRRQLRTRQEVKWKSRENQEERNFRITDTFLFVTN